MTNDAMERTGANEDDSDGIINYPLTVGDVEAVAFFREMSNSTYRISLRSKNRVNVARVAEHFGGGGHCNAAGFTAKADFDQLSREVIERLKDAVTAAPAVNGREIKPR
jgi:phosphoesterase RecJ-like protein